MTDTEFKPKYYEGIREEIHHLRRVVLFHSILYYSYNETSVDDTVFDKWAHELATLQKDHPEDSEAVEYMLEAFRDFNGDTGFHLPLWDKRMDQNVRRWLLWRKKGLLN